MTEQEARTKWCPSVRVELFGNAVVVNRYKGKLEETYNCIASDCMMWRWHSPSKSPEKRSGYCGLGGKP